MTCGRAASLPNGSKLMIGYYNGFANFNDAQKVCERLHVAN